MVIYCSIVRIFVFELGIARGSVPIATMASDRCDCSVLTHSYIQLLFDHLWFLYYCEFSCSSYAICLIYIPTGHTHFVCFLNFSGISTRRRRRHRGAAQMYPTSVSLALLLSRHSNLSEVPF